MSNYYNMPKLPTENSPKVEIFVDDKPVMVPGDTNLLEALKAVGIETPHVCYHPFLPVSGNCRQCLVEQEGPRGRMLVIACYTPVAPGMKIYTPASSARVKNARKATQEFMLVNHPLDCPICDKAGECTLQENYMEAGQNGSLMPRVSSVAVSTWTSVPASCLTKNAACSATVACALCVASPVPNSSNWRAVPTTPTSLRSLAKSWTTNTTCASPTFARWAP